MAYPPLTQNYSELSSVYFCFASFHTPQARQEVTVSQGWPRMPNLPASRQAPPRLAALCLVTLYFTFHSSLIHPAQEGDPVLPLCGNSESPLDTGSSFRGVPDCQGLPSNLSILLAQRSLTLTLTIISLCILTFKAYFYIHELYYFSFSSFYEYTLISHSGCIVTFLYIYVMYINYIHHHRSLLSPSPTLADPLSHQATRNF